MNTPDAHAGRQRTARTAGLLYLIVVLTGIVSLAYVPSQTFVPGDAAATVQRIVASETLFRVGILAGLICYVAFALLPLVLHRLLSPVNPRAAVAMVALALISVPLALASLMHKLDVLSLIGAQAPLKAFAAESVATRVMQSLESYRNGILVTKVFWGLWLLPFGYLVFKSRLLPRLLGVLLMLGCFGYLIDVGGRLLFAGYAGSGLDTYITLPAALGEIGTCLWLLIIGVRRPPSPPPGTT